MDADLCYSSVQFKKRRRTKYYLCKLCNKVIILKSFVAVSTNYNELFLIIFFITVVASTKT